MPKIEIPANLQAALRKIEANGTIPLLIPVALETFLTEQGLYRSSMTPQEAWQTLQELAGPLPPEPVEPAPPPPEPADDQQEQSSKPKNRGFLGRNRNKGRD